MSPSRVQSVSLVSALIALLLVGLALALFGRLDPEPFSKRSFDEIREAVEGTSAADVMEILGAPDTRQEVFGGDQRWIWWRYTKLEGPGYAPEVRGRIVHLEIVFRNPGSGLDPPPLSEWSIDEALGVQYRFPE